MNIYQKIVEIRKTVDVFIKDTKGYNYDYVSGSQVLKKIKTKMDELGVVLEPHMTSQHYEIFQYQDKYNKPKIDYIVTGAMKMIWINADNPEDRAIVDWQTLGQQDEISKALGSGLTYAERYFLLKYFGVPTDKDDPDAKKPKNTKPTTLSSNEVQKVIDEVNKIALDLVKNKGKQQEVVDAVKKHHSSANYNGITDVAVANKVLEELKNIK